MAGRSRKSRVSRREQRIEFHRPGWGDGPRLSVDSFLRGLSAVRASVDMGRHGQTWADTRGIACAIESALRRIGKTPSDAGNRAEDGRTCSQTLAA
jgi:hypothetical protein